MQRAKDSLTWSPILRMLIEAYMFSVVSTFRAYKHGISFDADALNTVLSCLATVFALGYPAWIIWFLRKNKYRLSTPSFKAGFDTLYLNVDYFNKKALVFTPLWLLRQATFMGLAVFADSPLM